MRILWASNYPGVPTGYGTQTEQVVKRLVKAGHEVAVAANYGLSGREAELDSIHVYPQSYDAYGNDVIPADFMDWTKGKGLLVTLFDTWVYVRDRFAGLPVASWVPIDHYPVPPQVQDWCREHTPIAMSQYGRDVLKQAGIESTYIPHALELDTFRPRDREKTREERGWSDKFVVFINAANKGNNPIRKAWSEMFGSLSAFLQKHDDAIVYINAEIDGFQAPSLGLLATLWGLDPSRVSFVDQYAYKRFRTPPDELARIYSAADVLLSTSMGEGFGLAVLEAQACGLPAIVTNFSAQPELVGGGWTVGGQLWYDPGQHSFLMVPNMDHIVHRLDEAYEARDDQTIRENAVAKAQEYDADKVFSEGWVPFLEQMDTAINPPPKRKGKSNAARRRARKAA